MWGLHVKISTLHATTEAQEARHFSPHCSKHDQLINYYLKMQVTSQTRVTNNEAATQ